MVVVGGVEDDDAAELVVAVVVAVADIMSLAQSDVAVADTIDD